MASVRTIDDVRAELQKVQGKIGKLEQDMDDEKKELKKAPTEAHALLQMEIINKLLDIQKDLREEKKDLQKKLDERMFPSFYFHWFSHCSLVRCFLFPALFFLS